MVISIFEYSDPAQFIRDKWQEAKTKNPAFSMRSFAKGLGLSGHASLHRVISGQANIPKKYLPSFIHTFKLNPIEGLYLETLIDCKKAKTKAEQKIYYDRLSELSPKKSKSFVELETLKTLCDPLHFFLLEMTSLTDFSPNVSWINEKLYFKRTTKEIEQAWNRLIELKLIKNINNKWQKTHADLATPNDYFDLATQEYHKNVSEMAQKAIGKQEVKKREFHGYALNIEKKDLNKAKTLIREFANNFLNQIEAQDNCGEETYQLNLQFFRVTENSKPQGDI